MMEKLFEGAIWKSRFIVLLAVVFGLLGATVLFVVASKDIWEVSVYTIKTIVNNAHPEDFHEDIVSGLIGAIDLYLIAVVLFIFSFGIYELFISKIDVASENEIRNNSTILAIDSLDQLKDKIAKVIVMVLVVNFFQRVLHTEFSTALEMLYLALSIAALSVGLYFLGKVGK